MISENITKTMAVSERKVSIDLPDTRERSVPTTGGEEGEICRGRG
jgi:hypothetical protein